MQAASLVVGTAGHIDHGKTALVRVLTGVDLDALPEERERGITIALGFVPFDLPDGRRLAFVDVPGHERLVRTMVAGATGIDAVLLCVSTVDGVMPQTREHLAILELLGVRDGAVVLTMADLVDEELLELATEDVSGAVRGTFLEGCPVVPFSAITGLGKEEVVRALDGFRRPERDEDGPFRLPVDRAFVRPGFGTVVTGTVWSGSLGDGSQVTLLPAGSQARVRGIEVHGAQVRRARAGWRAALNLAGVDREQVPRGTVAAVGRVPCPRILDVHYRHLPASDPLQDGSPVRMLLGTAEGVGRLYIAADGAEVAPGTATWAQVRLDTPLPALPGDRFVIRRPSPQETLGGGVVVDPWARRMRRRDRVEAGTQLARLHEGDVEVWLERAGEQGLPLEEWRPRARGSDRGVQLGDRMLASPVVARLEGALLMALEAYHRALPLSLGANRRELRRGRLGHLGERVFDALVDRLGETGPVVVEGPLVRLSGFSVQLTDSQAVLQERMRASIAEAGLSGLAQKVLHNKHPEPEVAALVRLLEKEGVVVQVPGVGWVGREVLEGLQARIREWFTEESRLTPGQFKELTGLSRKTAIPLLEWLDKGRITRRSGDVRVAGPALQ
jgi:selenocysteine-specific elongation factor